MTRSVTYDLYVSTVSLRVIASLDTLISVVIIIMMMRMMDDDDDDDDDVE